MISGDTFAAAGGGEPGIPEPVCASVHEVEEKDERNASTEIVAATTITSRSAYLVIWASPPTARRRALQTIPLVGRLGKWG